VTVTARPNVAIVGLVERLTTPEDRETYAELLLYLGRLPPGDDFRKLAELLGLVSLVGQRIPEALRGFLEELRAQTKAAAEYHGQVDARLAALPQEIAGGVDPAAIAKAMSESLRQHLSTTALHDTASLLKAAVITLKSLSAELVTTLQPVNATLSEQTAKLIATGRAVDEQSEFAAQQQNTSKTVLHCVLGLALFLLGVLLGMLKSHW